MSAIYFDTSALVKLLLREPDAGIVDSLWDGDGLAASSRLSWPEVHAAVAAAARAGRIDSAGVAAALTRFRPDWRTIRTVELTPAVAASAAELALAHRLSGADAVHLASALVLGRTTVMATWDRRLADAAGACGLAVVTAPG